MPENNNVGKWEVLSTLHKNEIPVTMFVDEISAIKTTLVSSPDKEDLYRLFKNVANVSWDIGWNSKMSSQESREFLSTLMKGGMLPLALEMNNFTFLIENITRLTTHAIVRSRVGVTYAQQSTGNSDQRHCDVLVPRSMSTQNSSLLRDYIEWSLLSKEKYAKSIDNGMSVQESRIFLPSTNANKMYVSFNLMSLMSFYSKRSDRTEEYMQGNEVCRQIKNIFDNKFEELSPILKSGCGKSCAHSKNSPYVNGVYLPSKEDDVFEWNKKSFLYENTRDQMCWNENPCETTFYIGTKKVGLEEYQIAKCTKTH